MKYFFVVAALVGGAGGARRGHGALRGGGLEVLRHPAGEDGCPTRSRAPGTCRSASSGSPPPGWRPDCSSRRRSSGNEPKGQRLGVNFLFVALLVVVVGSLAGEWLGIQQKLGNLWFWFGAQGYEYVDLGRFWQILLFGGLFFWLWLM